MHHLNWLAILVAAVSTMAVVFLWYSPMLFAKPWMRKRGCDPNDKARVQGMQKSAGPAYMASFVASLISAFHTGAVSALGARRRSPCRPADWISCVAGIRGDCTVDGRAVHQAEHETVRDQHRLPTGVLPGDGGDFGGLAIAERAGYLPRDLSKKEAMSWSASSASGSLGLFQKACGRASKTNNCASTPARR